MAGGLARGKKFHIFFKKSIDEADVSDIVVIVDIG